MPQSSTVSLNNILFGKWLYYIQFTYTITDSYLLYIMLPFILQAESLQQQAFKGHR